MDENDNLSNYLARVTVNFLWGGERDWWDTKKEGF